MKNLLTMMNKVSKKNYVKEPKSLNLNSLAKIKNTVKKTSKAKKNNPKKAKVLKSTIGSLISYKKKKSNFS